ncbi:hypothetical protein BC940DRAFT_251655 [Gongronella butleri]|nr:hypothetical protein BC940DRAFT_251655 [Gongronella butleri]
MFKQHQQRSKPTPGSVMPEQMREELKEVENDDRKFSKRFVNKAANRKDKRKQERQAKSQRRQQHQQQRQQHQQVGKGKKRPIEQQQQPAAAQQKQQKEQPAATPASKRQKVAKGGKDGSQAVAKLAASNPQLYSLLDSDQLLDKVPGDDDDSRRDDLFAEDDQFIEYWERKLGMGKNKKYDKAFEKDGLLDIMGEIAKDDADNDEQDDKASGLDYLRQKRQQQKEKAKKEKMERNAESAVDDLFGDFEEGEEESDDDDDDEDMMDDDEDMMDDDEDMSDDDEDVDDMEDEASEDDEASDSEDDESDAAEIQEKEPKPEPKPVVSAATKYIPPHLRKAPTTKSEQQIRLQRQLQGLFNKLSESNMETILVDIEKLYSNYPRHDVNSTVTELILSAIAQKANLLDSFVILYATIVGSLYRLIGIEFAAHFVQTLMESFEKYYKQSQGAIARGDEEGDEGPAGAREAKNLLTLLIELYNFQVISCILIYDVIRSLIGQLDEQSVELLLKIVRTCGAQMRSDDPASLKDIIDAIHVESNKRDAKSISVRHKFMLETLTNIKNNKIKSSEASARQADKDMVTKMKRFLSGLEKKRATRSAEPLRVSLDDIHAIDTKGKWWLVGASWKANLVGTESEHAKAKHSKMASDLKKDQTLQQALLKLARKQGMNTDVRRSIFISLMGAEDYVDAFEKLMKLSLSEVQQREIPRVILQCVGNEKTFNPYYVHVSQRLCQLNHSFKVTFQYCLWDFLRELGLQDIGGLERTAAAATGETRVRLQRMVNLGKFFGLMVAGQTFALTVFRTVNFISLTPQAQIFLDILFAHMLLQLKDDVQGLKHVMLKVIQLPTLAQGILLHLQGSLLKGNRTGLSSDELDAVRAQCQLVKTIVKALPTQH